MFIIDATINFVAIIVVVWAHCSMADLSFHFCLINAINYLRYFITP